MPWWLVVLVLGGLGFGGWKWLESRSAKKPRVFTTVKVDRGRVEDGIVATGTLQALETVDVGALVSGRVLSLSAEENQEVKAGQVIAVIDPEPYRARVEQARASMQVALAAQERAGVEKRLAERERDRVVALGDQGALGISDVDSAESAVELGRAAERSAAAEVSRARAGLHAAQLDLDRTTIVAPIDGLVLSRPVEVGQSMTAGFATPTLFTIARDLREMEVRAAVDEADVGKVREGMDARFSVDAWPGEEFKGRIAQIRRSPTVTQNVVTYEALIRVDNPEKKLWPGMTTTVRVITASRDGALRVPNAALRFKAPKDMLASAGLEESGGGEKGKDRPARGAPAGAGKDAAAPPGKGGAGRPKATRRVWKLVDGQPRPVELEVGIADEEHTEVLAGELAEGDELVTEIPGEASGPKPQGGPQGGGRGGAGGPRGPRM